MRVMHSSVGMLGYNSTASYVNTEHPGSKTILFISLLNSKEFFTYSCCFDAKGRRTSFSHSLMGWFKQPQLELTGLVLFPGGPVLWILGLRRNKRMGF